MGALNPNVLKKYAAITVIGALCSAGYFLGILYYGIMGGIGFFFGALAASFVIGNFLLDHPFRRLVEGQGLALMNLDSTGYIHTFLCKVQQPFILGKGLDGKPVRDIFDREYVSHLKPPKRVKAFWGGRGR